MSYLEILFCVVEYTEILSVSPKIDPKLVAYFKENARRIISEDRSARKNGASQNTIGQITRAISQAYVMGQSGQGYNDLPGAKHSSNIVDWAIIPPRSRITLEAMSLGLSKRLGLQDDRLSVIERLSDDPRPRWSLTHDGERVGERTFAHGGVAPLVRMKLLVAVDGSKTVFQLTELGQTTCQEYWRRSDANDPTLPKISLR
jgi:hypothetical protein